MVIWRVFGLVEEVGGRLWRLRVLLVYYAERGVFGRGRRMFISYVSYFLVIWGFLFLVILVVVGFLVVVVLVLLEYGGSELVF